MEKELDKRIEEVEEEIEHEPEWVKANSVFQGGKYEGADNKNEETSRSSYGTVFFY